MWLKNFILDLRTHLFHGGTHYAWEVPEKYWNSDEYMDIVNSDFKYGDLVVKFVRDWLKANIEGVAIVRAEYACIRITFSRPSDAVMVRLKGILND